MKLPCLIATLRIFLYVSWDSLELRVLLAWLDCKGYPMATTKHLFIEKSCRIKHPESIEYCRSLQQMRAGGHMSLQIHQAINLAGSSFSMAGR
jgi:hypothetical protein